MISAWPLFPPKINFNFKVSREVKSNGRDMALGDGYVYRTTFGLHPFDESLRGTLFLDSADVAIVREFLEARATDGAPFMWLPAWVLMDSRTFSFDSLQTVDEVYPYATAWMVEEWPITQGGPLRSTIDLQLVRQWSHVVEE
ncbi:MAG: hypothetical protein WCO50_00490 [Synechococcus sp. ELA619]